MKKGFTLIELLAVIVILAIIALITTPAVLRMTDNAKVSSYRRSIDLYGKAINTAITAYKSDKIEKKEPYKVTFENVSSYVDYEGNDVECNISKIYSDDAILLTECKVEGTEVYAEGNKGYGENNYYYYTNATKRIKSLLYIDTVNNALKEKDNVGNTCQVQSNGNLICNGKTIEIKSPLENPISGTLTIENKEVTSYTKLEFKNQKVETQEEIPQVVDEQQTNTSYENNNNNNNANNNTDNNNSSQRHYATLIQDNNNNGEPNIGDKYTYEVKSGTTYNFYVLSIEGTGANQKANLIMDRNICNDGTVTYTSTNNYCRYAWYSAANNNTYGPTTVMAELYAGTKDWDNVSDMIMNYTDENNGTATDMGYTSIITSNGVTTITGKPTTNTSTVGTALKPLKARLPKQSEVMGAGCTTGAGSCPTWLMENMTYYNVSNDKYSTNNNSEAYQNIYGYWLLSSTPGDSYGARIVYYNGYVGNVITTNGGYGARPVITVSTSDLSN